MQNYKPTDEKELKFENSAGPVLDLISNELDLLNSNAFTTGPLGDLLVESARAPLSKAIEQTIFRSAFKEIFDAFIKVGTFEAYITVFKKIFGDSVNIIFTIPAPGKLNIEIEAAGVEFFDFVERRVVSNAYVYNEVVDYDLANIVFQIIRGFQTQYELEQMLFEMVPGGIYTEITLTLGA